MREQTERNIAKLDLLLNATGTVDARRTIQFLRDLVVHAWTHADVIYEQAVSMGHTIND